MRTGFRSEIDLALKVSYGLCDSLILEEVFLLSSSVMKA